MKSLVAVSLLVTFSCLLPSHNADTTPKYDSEPECRRSVDVAIVGAGAAGTYSAYKLRNENLWIELVELSNRVGGRMFTIDMPDSPDVKIELGIMKFAKDEHSRVERLAAELNLTPEDFLEGRPEQKKYFLRGEMLTADQIQSGDVPFRLSPKEKENQGRLAQYYLQELTGFNGSSLSYEQALKLTVQDGRPLHKLRLEEALNMVATEEGKELVRALGEFDGPWAEEATATAFFRIVLGDDTQAKDRTLSEGMNKLPESLAQAFLQASKNHQVSLNRKLEKIEKLDSEDVYRLSLTKTITKEGRTTETDEEESVCAKKVVLAIPHHALLELESKDLKTGKVKDALEALISVKSSKVYMSFRKSENYSFAGELSKTHAFKSDTPISQMIKWKVSEESKQNILLASCADMHKAEFLEALNSEGSLYPGSSPGQYEASNSLVQEVINHLSEAKGVPKSEFPKPIKVVTKFWSTFPYSGSSTILKAGHNPEDVRQTIRQPVLGEEMYIVGSDHASFQSETWGLESALASVDEVYEKYRIDS